MPVTEVLTLRIPSFVYQAFYVYLYTVSILFVIFVYTAHMRTRAVFSLIKTYRKCPTHGFDTIQFAPDFDFSFSILHFCRRENEQRLFGEETYRTFWKLLFACWRDLIRHWHNGLFGTGIWTIFRNRSYGEPEHEAYQFSFRFFNFARNFPLQAIQIVRHL